MKTTISDTKKTPKLRFRGFSDEWKEKKVEDIYLFVWTNSLSRENLSNEAAGYKNIHYGDIHTKYGQRLDTTEENIGIPYIKSGPRVIIDRFLPTSVLKEKDIVMTDASEDYKDIGKCLEVIKTEGKTVAGLHTIVLRPYKDDVASSFGTYLFNSPQLHKHIARLATGVSVLGISKSNLSNLLLKLPSLEEQKKIAGFLGMVDDKIFGLEKKKELLEKYKKGVMQKIFTRQIRFKGFSDNWGEKKLCELGIFKSGVGFSENEQGGKNGVPFYKVSDMNIKGNEKTMVVANNYVSEEQVKKNKYNIINNPSIIFAKVGAAIFLERKRKAKSFLIDNNMMAFIPNDRVNYDFASFALNIIRLSRMAQVGALPSYNGSDLGIIKLRIPSNIEEQKKIADFLTALDDKIELQNKKLQQAKLFKKSLLQKMFV